MKVIQINATCDRSSTGNICISLSKLLFEEQIDNRIYYSIGNSEYAYGIKYMTNMNVISQSVLSHILGNYGFNTIIATKRLIRELEKYQPDVIHLHNLHSHNCNLTMLFSYIRKNNIKVIWTFHDCWAFTAYCTHFSADKCEKWKTECSNCPQRKKYSWFFDRSNFLFRRKRKLLSNINLTIITPSNWMKNIVKESFLKDYNIKVINNGIDLNVFKPRKSTIRNTYGLMNDTKIILGVSSVWNEKKGLDVFLELCRNLDNEKYQIILVGTNEQIDEKLPNDIISIHKTNDVNELAELYSVADVFVNPSREDTFPTVNIEAIACGTPVIAFDIGGNSDVVSSEVGALVECDNIEQLVSSVKVISNNKHKYASACIEKSKHFNKNNNFKEYLYYYELP